MTAGLPSMKSILTPLAKNVFCIIHLHYQQECQQQMRQLKIYGWGSLWCAVALVISKEEMEDIIKIVKSLEEPRLLVKGIDKTIQDKTKEQKKNFFKCC